MNIRKACLRAISTRGARAYHVQARIGRITALAGAKSFSAYAKRRLRFLPKRTRLRYEIFAITMGQRCGTKSSYGRTPTRCSKQCRIIWTKVNRRPSHDDARHQRELGAARGGGYHHFGRNRGHALLGGVLLIVMAIREYMLVIVAVCLFVLLLYVLMAG